MNVLGFIVYWLKYGYILWFFWNWIYSSRHTKQNQRKIKTHNIFRIQSDDSVMCGFYCIVIVEYIISGKTLLDYSNLFSPNDYQKKDKITYKYLKNE